MRMLRRWFILNASIPKLLHTIVYLVLFSLIAMLLIRTSPTWPQPVITLCNHMKRSEDRKSSTAWRDWSSVDKLFVFGDSHSAGGFDPYGLQPRPENPFGNPVFPAHRTNGGVAPDFLTLNYNQSFIMTYNLAQGGATIDNGVFASIYGSLSFRDQVQRIFQPIYASPTTHFELRWDPQKTLFMTNFGINEVTIDYLRDDLHLVVSKVIAAYQSLLESLYSLGARNFLILTLGPVDRNFAARTGANEKSDRLAKHIAEFNRQLRQVKQSLTAAHDEVTAFVFDMNDFLSWLARNPQSFDASKNLQNTTDVCVEYSFGLGVPNQESGLPSFEQFHPACGIPLTQYFWANEFHMTYPVQNATAAAIVADCFGLKREGSCV